MRKSWILLSFALTAVFPSSVAFALPQAKNNDAGLQACYNWCYAHNSYDRSRNSCYDGCDNYYRCTVAKRNSECDTARVPNMSTASPNGSPVTVGPVGVKPGRLKPPRLLLPPVRKTSGVVQLKRTN